MPSFNLILRAFSSLGHDLETDENTTNPQQVPPTLQASHTLSTIKLYILKKEGLHKGYDRFQSLLSQLKTHGAGASTEDANQKFLRTLPSSWSQVSLITRTKPGVDTLNFDDPTTILECLNLMLKVLLDHLLAHRISKRNQDSRRRDAGNTGYKARDNGKRPAKQDKHKAMVTVDGEGSDTKVTSCSKVCEESYAKLNKLYDEQREQLGVARIEIQAYTLALKKSSDVEDSHMTDRFVKVEGMHAVPPPMTGNYMPLKSDFRIDESKFTYAANEPKAVNEPKVWSDAPIIEEYESDSDDEHVTLPSKEQEKPSFAFVNTVEHLKTPRQTIKEQHTCSQNPKPNNRDWD
nr:ribonuclease H-like domain-containing protein [Tanacetum cinerariifolium]